MDFSLDLFPLAYPDRQSGADYFRQSLDLCEMADHAGFNRVKVIEHYFHPYGGYSPSPATYLAAISQRTEKLRLVTGAVIPAFNHPLKLAGELAMVDCMSNGRLDVGFARAFLPHEFDAFDVSMDESRARFEEGIEAVLRLWTEEEVDFQGRFHQFSGVTSLPKVVQQPHPPVWVATVATPESFIWTGERGYNLMVVPYLGDFGELAENIKLYREAYRESGHGERGGIMMAMHMYIAEDRKTAVAEAKGPMDDYIRAFREPAALWLSRQSSNYARYGRIVELIDALNYDRILNETRALIGDPGRHHEATQVHSRGLRGCGAQLPSQLQHDHRRSSEAQPRAVLPRSDAQLRGLVDSLGRRLWRNAATLPHCLLRVLLLLKQYSYTAMY